MDDFDAIIIGAGPAGTAAAHDLAKLGRRVLLLDRKRFPRVKPCGGGLTIKSLEIVPVPVGAVIETATTSLKTGVHDRREDVFAADSYLCAFAVREKYDAHVLRQVLETGAAFEEIKTLDEVAASGDGVRVRVNDSRTIRGRYLIGADGANSTVRALTHQAGHFRRGFALEGIVPYAKIGGRPPAEFIFGWVKDGYGWLFPKGDHVNVGIYTGSSHVKIGRAILAEYCRARIETDALEGVAGFPLGFGGQYYKPLDQRVILVGDAGGFAEPLLGEGIYNAIKTGRAAARAIDDGLNRIEAANVAFYRYSEEVRKDLIRCDSIARGLFYPNLLKIGYGALTLPIARSALTRGFAAGKTIREITNSFFLSPLYRTVIPSSLREFLHRERERHNGAPGAALHH